LNAEHRQTPSGSDERVPGTGLTIVFDGGKRLIDNAEVFEHLMNNAVFRNGRVRIDPEDPTGFWREAGVLKPEMKEVAVRAVVTRAPEFDKIPDVKKMKKPEKSYVPIVLN
jgi:hypothetical protein